MNKDLSYKLGDIISILDNSWNLDCSWPIIVIETLSISELEYLFLIQISVISNLNIPGGRASTLSDILGDQKEFEAISRNHFRVYNCAWITIHIILTRFLHIHSSRASSLLSDRLLLSLLSWLNEKSIFYLLSHYKLNERRLITTSQLFLQSLYSLINLWYFDSLYDFDHAVSHSISIQDHLLRQFLILFKPNFNTIYNLIGYIFIYDFLVFFVLLESPAIILSEIFVHGAADSYNRNLLFADSTMMDVDAYDHGVEVDTDWPFDFPYDSIQLGIHL